MHSKSIGVIGLGYVGLPLAIGLGEKVDVRGFDINEERVQELSNNFDRGTQISSSEFLKSKNFKPYSDARHLKDCDVYIVSVPTPVNDDNKPDLSYLRSASIIVAEMLTPGNLVIFESTVYPGATEDICIPILEDISELTEGENFDVGYSPERINPGDPNTSLQSVTKVISSNSMRAINEIRSLYEDLLGIKTFTAKNIKTAEAAKALENTQRDVNIALMNEMSHLFKSLDIDISDVLDAAETKWNFVRYNPGLVGGHCIRIDPHYLIHVAKENNLDLQVTSSARSVNDGMASYIVKQLIEMYSQRKIEIEHSRMLVMGLTYKENFPDVRSSLVFDIIEELSSMGILIDVLEPVLDDKTKINLNLNFIDQLKSRKEYDGVLVAVAHDQFKLLDGKEVKLELKDKGFIYDVKCVFPKGFSDNSL